MFDAYELLVMMCCHHGPWTEDSDKTTASWQSGPDDPVQDCVLFTQAYAPCAGMNEIKAMFLTGQSHAAKNLYRPHISGTTAVPTFVHCMSLGGCETILIGQMPADNPDRQLGFDQWLGNMQNASHQAVQWLSRPHPSRQAIVVWTDDANDPEENREDITAVCRAFRQYLKRKGTKGLFICTTVYDDRPESADRGSEAPDITGHAEDGIFPDTALRVRLMIAGDGIVPGIIDTPVSLADLTATICSLSGGPELPMGDGMDLTPVLFGEVLPEKFYQVNYRKKVPDLRLAVPQNDRLLRAWQWAHPYAAADF